MHTCGVVKLLFVTLLCHRYNNTDALRYRLLFSLTFKKIGKIVDRTFRFDCARFMRVGFQLLSKSRIDRICHRHYFTNCSYISLSSLVCLYLRLTVCFRWYTCYYYYCYYNYIYFHAMLFFAYNDKKCFVS